MRGSDDEATLLAALRELELELQCPATRADAARLDPLLHDDFVEHGRSGATYAKADILARLTAEASTATSPVDIVSDRFELHPIGNTAALLTYRSAHRLADGTLDRFTLRASLWERDAHGWRVRFHQGTATSAFVPDMRGSP